MRSCYGLRNIWTLHIEEIGVTTTFCKVRYPTTTKFTQSSKSVGICNVNNQQTCITQVNQT